jgi:hypothetical protein
MFETIKCRLKNLEAALREPVNGELIKGVQKLLRGIWVWVLLSLCHLSLVLIIPNWLLKPLLKFIPKSCAILIIKYRCSLRLFKNGAAIKWIIGALVIMVILWIGFNMDPYIGNDGESAFLAEMMDAMPNLKSIVLSIPLISMMVGILWEAGRLMWREPGGPLGVGLILLLGVASTIYGLVHFVAVLSYVVVSIGVVAAIHAMWNASNRPV